MEALEPPQESGIRYIQPSAELLRDYTFTSRRPMHMSSPSIGDQLLTQHSITRLMPQPKARPLSASVQANAWKSFGSPRAKGQMRVLPVPDKMHPNPKSSVIDSMAGRPASVLTLGGGYQLTRPQTAPTAYPPHSSSGGNLSPPRTPQSLSHRISGDKIETPPSMSRPMTAVMPGPKQQFTDEYRLAETLPTDPKALGVWQAHLRRHTPSFVKPSTSSRPRTAAPSLSDHHQPTTGLVRTSSERFSSMSLRSMHNMGSSFRPTIVTGHSQPESEIHLPEKSALRYSRMGQTSMSYMYKNIKMTGGRPASAPNSMNPVPPHWPISPKRQSPTRHGHDQESHNGIFYISENALGHSLPPYGSPDLTVSGNIMHPQVHNSSRRPSSGNAQQQPNIASCQHPSDVLEENHPPGQYLAINLSTAPVPTISECEFEGETPAATVLLGTPVMPPAPTISMEAEGEEESNLVQEDEDVGSGPEDEVEAMIMRVSKLDQNNGVLHTHGGNTVKQSTLQDKQETDLSHLHSEYVSEPGSHFPEVGAVKLQGQAAVGEDALSILHNESTDLQGCETDKIESRQQIVEQLLSVADSVDDDTSFYQDSGITPGQDNEEEDALIGSLKNLTEKAGSMNSSRPSSNTRPTSARPNSRPMSARPVSGASSGRGGTSSPDRPSTAACNDITLGVIGEETVNDAEGS